MNHTNTKLEAHQAKLTVPLKIGDRVVAVIPGTENKIVGRIGGSDPSGFRIDLAADDAWVWLDCRIWSVEVIPPPVPDMSGWRAALDRDGKVWSLLPDDRWYRPHNGGGAFMRNDAEIWSEFGPLTELVPAGEQR